MSHSNSTHPNTTLGDAPSPGQLGAPIAGSALTVVFSPHEEAIGRVLPLTAPLAIVGREVSGDGCLSADTRLSRTHCRVVFDRRAMCHRIGDAKSRNGTFVNGARVELAVLEPGDVVRAGESVFVYGRPDPMAKLRERVAALAPSGLTVLLLGETGTGKERIARALHEQSGRSGQLVAVNCAAFTKELLAAELFGHTRGAFSGATRSRSGLLLAAQGGTLFLDEIADLPTDLQAALLRTLQERTIRPLGSDRELSIDVRIIAATHSGLDEGMRNGRFRQDLYARLTQAIIRLPLLRERRTDILELARTFARDAGKDFKTTADAAEALVRWQWPLNVRELQSLVFGFCAVERERALTREYLAEHHPEIMDSFRDTTSSAELSDATRPVLARLDARRVRLEMLLAEQKGNVSAVARELGKPRAQVYRWLRSLGLAPERFR